MELMLEDRSVRCRGAMIPSGVSHCIHTEGSDALVFLCDNTAGISAQIRTVQCIPEEVCSDILKSYADFERNEIPYGQFYGTFLECIGITGARCRVTDGRILEAMAYIRARVSDGVTCREAAEAVCLSQSRFSHLFRKETGMTFASYLVSQRILYVYAQRFRGESLTEAAIEAGFSSSAHFADVNRRVFGLTASSITREWVFRIAEI